jgi:hypothetical protein
VVLPTVEDAASARQQLDKRHIGHRYIECVGARGRRGLVVFSAGKAPPKPIGAAARQGPRAAAALARGGSVMGPSAS